MSQRRLFGSDHNRTTIAGLDERYIEQFLLDHLRHANLQRQGHILPEVPDQEFNSNEEFWQTFLRARQASLKWVNLVNFRVIDWFPRTPGLYHTSNAAYARREAEAYVREENGIRFYEPRGKTHMMQGGIGAVRFKPVNIEGSECWLCTATSDKYCHSGIPLAIPNHLMNQIDSNLNYTYKITGQVKFLPEFLERHFHHMTKIPQIYVLVDTVKELTLERSTLLITPMVFFKADHDPRPTEFRIPPQRRYHEEGFVTYVTCPASSLDALDKSADWLQWYTRKYHGEIITNFDQQRPVFQEAPFSLQNVMNGTLDKDRFHQFNIYNAEIICDAIQSIHAGLLQCQTSRFCWVMEQLYMVILLWRTLSRTVSTRLHLRRFPMI